MIILQKKKKGPGFSPSYVVVILVLSDHELR
jgi:hypothetical protein